MPSAAPLDDGRQPCPCAFVLSLAEQGPSGGLARMIAKTLATRHSTDHAARVLAASD